MQASLCFNCLIEQSDETNSKIVEILAKLTEKLSIKLLSHGENSDSTLAIGDSLPHLGHAEHMAAHTVKPKLPKLTLKRFKGDVITFHFFWDQFNSTVHANSSIPNTDKFKHLKALLEGPAARVIQGLTLTSLNYNHARKLLEERYGRPQVIIRTYMENLLKISPCTTDQPKQLRYMYDQICVQMRGLESLGITNESYGQLLIPIIMSKMPSDMRLQISRSTKKKYGTLMNF